MKKIILIGAGFSYDLGMPLASELSDVFFEIFTSQNIKRLGSQLALMDPYGIDRPINEKAIFEGLDLLHSYKSKSPVNYEEFLTQLIDLGKQPKKKLSDRDSYSFLFAIFYDIIHQILSIYQNISYAEMYKDNSRWYKNLLNILNENETWIFSLNHDLYIECLCLDYGIPITYGDKEEIVFPINNLKKENVIKFSCIDRTDIKLDNSYFFKNSFGINLIKLHGGLSELEYEYKDGSIICNLPLNQSNSIDFIHSFNRIDEMCYYDNGIRIPSGREMFVTNSNGELDFLSKSMLTGGDKYSKTLKLKEGEEKLRLFEDALSTVDEILIIGYSYGDKHINNRILNQMVKNENLKIWRIDPYNNKVPDFLEQFDYDLRLRVGCCTAAQWIEYIESKQWNGELNVAMQDNSKKHEEIKEEVILFYLTKKLTNNKVK